MTLTVESNLESELERLLLSVGHDGARIVSLVRKSNPYATLAPIEQISLTLDDRRQLELFLKHLIASEENHPNKQVRDREVRVYEELFRPAGNLPVPRCYGGAWDDQTQRGWLALDHLNGWCLKYHSLDRWFEAARSLARFQRYFSDRISQLKRADFLLKLDECYFDAWFRRAQQTVERIAPELAAELSPVTRGAQDIAALMVRYGATLVHNDLAPKNVLASLPGELARIDLVDWEMAGVGCGAIDLVQLKDGLDSDADRRIRDIYCQELEGTGMLPAHPDERERLFAACDLHKTIYRLARCAPWNLPQETLGRWIVEARRLAQFIAGG